MKRKILLLVILLLFLSSVIPLAEGRIFDFRTRKELSSPRGIVFDNLPHIDGYSGLFVGDTKNISGRVDVDLKGPIEIIFPSGKIVKISRDSKGYFTKTITFDEEGTYKVKFGLSDKVAPHKCEFDVCYRAIPLPPTILVRDILNGVSQVNDDTQLASINWNDACVIEEGKEGNAYLLIVDKDGNPLANLKGKYFTTDRYGIAKIPFSSGGYGNIRTAVYDKLVFDEKGNLIYSSKEKKIGAILQDGTLYLNKEDFFSYVFPEAHKQGGDMPLMTRFTYDLSKITVTDNYILEPITNFALPAKVIKKRW